MTSMSRQTYIECHDGKLVKRRLPIKQDNIAFREMPLYNIASLKESKTRIPRFNTSSTKRRT